MRGIRVICAALAMVFAVWPQARAEDLFDFLFGPDTPSRAHSHAEPSYRREPQWRRRPGLPRASLQVAPGDGAGTGTGAPSASSWSGGFCVRTCDGYYFPLIPSERTTRQKSCEYACPSAPMAIYYGSAIEGARNYKGEKYTSLKTAFSFRDKATPRCSCNRPENSQAFFVRIARSDPTLRAGDIIFDATGAYVYSGSGFSPAARSSLVPSWTRERLRAMLETARGRARSRAAAEASQSNVIWAKPKEIDRRPVSATPAAGAPEGGGK